MRDGNGRDTDRKREKNDDSVSRNISIYKSSFCIYIIHVELMIFILMVHLRLGMTDLERRWIEEEEEDEKMLRINESFGITTPSFNIE